MQCKSCKGFGHLAKDCHSKNTHQAKYVKESKKDEDFVFTSQILDISFKLKVKLGNDDFLKVKGKRSSLVQISSGMKYILLMFC